MSTKDLDDYAGIRDLEPYQVLKVPRVPFSICSSANNGVHGIPNKNKIIRDGDLVKLTLEIQRF